MGFLAQYEKSNEFEVAIAYTIKPQTPLNFRELFPSATRFFELPMSRAMNISQDIKSIIGLKKIIKTFQPDIVHLHSSKAGFIGRIGTIFSDIKICYSPHGYAFLNTSFGLYKRIIYKFAEFFMGHFLKGITIACGDSEYKYAQKNSVAYLIRNGVNINFNISDAELPTVVSQKVCIMTVGRITEERGVDYFVAVINKMPKDIDWIWVGDGNQLHKLKGIENLHVTGWVAQDTVISLVNRCDIYVHTSTMEGLPLAILQAMALKKPVVATNIFGNKDVVKNNESGFLCSSPDEFCDSLNKLMSSNELRSRMGEAGRKIVKQKFDVRKNFSAYLDLYKVLT